MFGRLAHHRMPDAVSVRQVSSLPRASFRFHLAVNTLASSYALGATPCALDFHALERAHAEHTKFGLPESSPNSLSYRTLSIGNGCWS